MGRTDRRQDGCENGFTCNTYGKYPSTSGVKFDIPTAREIYKLYSDELTAVSDYIYMSIIFEEHSPMLSELLESIAMDEMEHFKCLGQLIRNLGGNPAMNIRVKNTPINFRAEAFQHSRAAARNALEESISTEKNSSSAYEALASRVDDERISALMYIIAADENKHAERLLNAFDFN